MDEFSAYYHDTYASYKMYLRYEKLGDEYNGRKEMMQSNTLGVFFAYYEFNLFIGGYLAYLKKNNFKVYMATRSNKDLVHTYKALDQLFGDLVVEVEEEFKDDSIYRYFLNQRVNPTKRVLKQFLPELEALRSGYVAEQN
jgi:hypothetical protein